MLVCLKKDWNCWFFRSSLFLINDFAQIITGEASVFFRLALYLLAWLPLANHSEAAIRVHRTNTTGAVVLPAIMPHRRIDRRWRS